MLHEHISPIGATIGAGRVGGRRTSVAVNDNACMPAEPCMNRDPAFLANKKSRLQDPHIAPLNALVQTWRADRIPVPWVDPDSGGVHSRILFLHESPGPAASAGYGSGIISPDNNDQTAARFWRLSRDAGLPRNTYVNWNVVPWYVSADSTNVNASAADGQAALPYLHQFVTLLTALRAVVVMGGFAER
jgi:hypothetical protein